MDTSTQVLLHFYKFCGFSYQKEFHELFLKYKMSFVEKEATTHTNRGCDFEYFFFAFSKNEITHGKRGIFCNPSQPVVCYVEMGYINIPLYTNFSRRMPI